MGTFLQWVARALFPNNGIEEGKPLVADGTDIERRERTDSFSSDFTIITLNNDDLECVQIDEEEIRLLEEGSKDVANDVVDASEHRPENAYHLDGSTSSKNVTTQSTDCRATIAGNSVDQADGTAYQYTKFDNAEDCRNNNVDEYPEPVGSLDNKGSYKSVRNEHITFNRSDQRESPSHTSSGQEAVKSTNSTRATPKRPPLKSHPSMFSFLANYPQSVQAFEGMNKKDLQSKPSLERKGTLDLISNFLFRSDSDSGRQTGDNSVDNDLGSIAEEVLGDIDRNVPWKENCCDYEHDLYGNRHSHSVREDYDEHVKVEHDEHVRAESKKHKNPRLDIHDEGSKATQNSELGASLPTQQTSSRSQGTTQDKTPTQSMYRTRTDELSLAEQGAAGSRSSLGSSERGGYENEDTQNVVGEPADEGLIAGVGDDILYPEEALLDPNSKGPVSICGELDVAFQYSGEARRMNVTVIQAYNLPGKEQGGCSSYRLRLLLYPTKRQRAKTRIREGSDPEFKELFRFTRLYPHELVTIVLRLRLYGTERMRRERLIGEGKVKFSSLNTATQQMVRVKMESKSEISTGGGSGSPYSSSSDLSHSESNSSLPSMHGGHGNIPELLVGLSYNATTGRLGVEIIKGSHFKHLSGGRAPDSYVKVALMSSSGFEMTKSKTSVRRGQPHPTFKETFIFQVAQFQLADVTLLFTVFNKKGMKRKDTIGWFSMGLSNSSEEELAHWNEMRETRGHQVSRWHALLDS